MNPWVITLLILVGGIAALILIRVVGRLLLEAISRSMSQRRFRAPDGHVRGDDKRLRSADRRQRSAYLTAALRADRPRKSQLPRNYRGGPYDPGEGS